MTTSQRKPTRREPDYIDAICEMLHTCDSVTLELSGDRSALGIRASRDGATVCDVSAVLATNIIRGVIGGYEMAWRRAILEAGELARASVAKAKRTATLEVRRAMLAGRPAPAAVSEPAAE